jgi:hypothetical protein
MAQTNITAGIGDQVSLEGVGSGSGLLDLTRESDDTSLGAELLDEITPSPKGGGRARPASIGDSSMGGVVTSGSATTTRRGPVMPVQQETADALAPAFGAAALGAAAFVLFGAVVLVASLLHTKPGIAAFVMDSQKPPQFIVIAGIGLGVTVVFFIFGLFIGKATTR